MTISAFFNDSSDIAERVMWKNMNSKSQCSVAKVTGINTSPVSVNIQPLVNYFDQIEGYSQYPELKFIPIAQMQQATYSLNLPINVGDTGIVLWFDREVYTALLQPVAAPKSPESGDMMNVSACVFIPMMPLFSISNALPLKTTGVDVRSAGISLLNQLITLCTQLGNLITAIENITVSGVGTPTPFQVVLPGPIVPPGTYPVAGVSSNPLNTTDFTPITSAINQIKSNLTTFLGSQP